MSAQPQRKVTKKRRRSTLDQERAIKGIVPPELSAKRRAAGIAGRAIQQLRQGKPAAVKLSPTKPVDMSVLMPAIGGHFSPRRQPSAAALARIEAEELAAAASPGLVSMLVSMAHDQDVGKRDRIQAAMAVFKVARIGEGGQSAEGGDNKDVSDMSAEELRLFIYRGAARMQALEAAQSDMQSDGATAQPIDSPDNPPAGATDCHRYSTDSPDQADQADQAPDDDAGGISLE